MKKYKAILFDFDGVIGNTMEDNSNAWEHAFFNYNIKFDKREYLQFEGFNPKKVVEYFTRGLPGTTIVDADEIINLKERFYLKNNKFSFYDGVETLITGLKGKGYLLGLVTAANYSRLLKTVKKEVLELFNIVITGDKTINCKPHPEPYLNAANALSVRPSDCMVVENAPLGIEAAKAAGMHCIAVASTLEKKYLQNADKIIDKISYLEGIL